MWRRLIDEAARLVIERIATSDALYHDAEHTALVTLVAQDILRGLRLSRDIHGDRLAAFHRRRAGATTSVICVASVAGDTAERQIIDDAGNSVTMPRGSSDAFLAPYHVFRSKAVVRDRFAHNPLIDGERVAQAIELTRFPIPDDADHAQTDTEAGLLRAADLIGQLGDPLYPRKLNALFYEFSEIGVNAKLGYATPADRGRAISDVLLAQGRTVYRRRDTLPRIDHRRAPMGGAAVQQCLRDRTPQAAHGSDPRVRPALAPARRRGLIVVRPPPASSATPSRRS